MIVTVVVIVAAVVGVGAGCLQDYLPKSERNQEVDQ